MMEDMGGESELSELLAMINSLDLDDEQKLTIVKQKAEELRQVWSR